MELPSVTETNAKVKIRMLPAQIISKYWSKMVNFKALYASKIMKIFRYINNNVNKPLETLRTIMSNIECFVIDYEYCDCDWGFFDF